MNISLLSNTIDRVDSFSYDVKLNLKNDNIIKDSQRDLVGQTPREVQQLSQEISVMTIEDITGVLEGIPDTFKAQIREEAGNVLSTLKRIGLMIDRAENIIAPDRIIDTIISIDTQREKFIGECKSMNHAYNYFKNKDNQVDIAP